MEFVSANLLGIIVGYCLCVLVPIPFLEGWIRAQWAKPWIWLWEHSLGRLMVGPQ
jgi:hypothetical protein